MGRKRKTTTKCFSDTSLDDSGISVWEGSSECDVPKKRRVAATRQYICHICDKQFKGTTDLKRHLLIHSDERPHICPTCSRGFRQASSLKSHIASIHSKERNFECEQCGKRFPIKERLKLHMRVHSGEKPYACVKCGKTFARGGQLRQHRAVHLKEKHFECDSCSESFSTTFDLKKHREVKHTVKPLTEDFRCHICEESFTKLPKIKSHLNAKHKNTGFFCTSCRAVIKGDTKQHMSSKHSRAFDCDICGAKFSQKSQLKLHQRKHSGERPYECKVCNDRFAHTTVLKLHYRKHTGEKPFPCPLCTKQAIAFTQLAHMKHHMKVIHKQEQPYLCRGCKVFYKTKSRLEIHLEESLKCKEIEKKFEDAEVSDVPALSNLRILLAAVIKKISKPQLLADLGFNRRLIDNVLKDSLESSKQPYIQRDDISDLDCLRLNTMTFLSWIVPLTKMKILREKNTSPEEILENILNPVKEVPKNQGSLPPPESSSLGTTDTEEQNEKNEILDMDTYEFTITEMEVDSDEEDEDVDDDDEEESLQSFELKSSEF